MFLEDVLQLVPDQVHVRIETSTTLHPHKKLFEGTAEDAWLWATKVSPGFLVYQILMDPEERENSENNGVPDYNIGKLIQVI